MIIDDGREALRIKMEKGKEVAEGVRRKVTQEEGWRVKRLKNNKKGKQLSGLKNQRGTKRKEDVGKGRFRGAVGEREGEGTVLGGD